MASEPLLLRKPVDRQEFKLIGSPRPSVKEVSSHDIRSDEHVDRPLAVRVAIESGVPEYCGEKRAGVELVAVRGPDGHTSLPVVRRGRLRHERVDIRKLGSVGEAIYIYRQQVPRREDCLETGQGIETLRFPLVVRPSQPANWTLSHVIGKRFRKVEFVLQNRSPEKQARRPIRNADDLTVLTAEAGDEVHHPKVPTAGGRLCL